MQINQKQAEDAPCRLHTRPENSGKRAQDTTHGAPWGPQPHTSGIRPLAGRRSGRRVGSQRGPQHPLVKHPSATPAARNPEQGQGGCNPDHSPLSPPGPRFTCPSNGGTHACWHGPSGHTGGALRRVGVGAPGRKVEVTHPPAGWSLTDSDSIRSPQTHFPPPETRRHRMEAKPFAAASVDTAKRGHPPTSWAPHPHTSAPTWPLGLGQGRPPCQAVVVARGAGQGPPETRREGRPGRAGAAGRAGDAGRQIQGCAAPAGPVGPRVHCPNCPGTGHPRPSLGPRLPSSR